MTKDFRSKRVALRPRSPPMIVETRKEEVPFEPDQSRVTSVDECHSGVAADVDTDVGWRVSFPGSGGEG